MSDAALLLADLNVNGWAIAGVVVAVLLLGGVAWNIKDIIRYIRISRM